MTILNRIASNWSRQERERLNGNWDIIERYLSGLQGQINLLTGDVNVQELIDELNRLLSDGTIILGELESALNNVAEIITNAQNATDNANDATQSALNAINDMQNIINGFRNKGTYNNEIEYSINNMVFHEGSSYIYTNETSSAGNPPPKYPTLSNVYWQMTAAKGASGDGAVSKVNGKEPDGGGEVILTASDVGAASNEHLAEIKPKVDNSWQKGVYNDANITNLSKHVATRTFRQIDWKSTESTIELWECVTTLTESFWGTLELDIASFSASAGGAKIVVELGINVPNTAGQPSIEGLNVMKVISASKGFTENFYIQVEHRGDARYLLIKVYKRKYNDPVTVTAKFTRAANFQTSFDLLKSFTAGVVYSSGITAPTTLQHDLNYRVPTVTDRGKWDAGYDAYTRFQGVCMNMTDWNNLPANGMYMAHGAHNSPDMNHWYMGFNIVHNDLFIVQKVVCVVGDLEYERKKQDGVWGAWVETSPRKLFQSVSNGKAAVNQAVTDMDIYTAPDAPFEVTAANIRKLGGRVFVGNVATPEVPNKGDVSVYSTLIDFKPTYAFSDWGGMVYIKDRYIDPTGLLTASPQGGGEMVQAIGVQQIGNQWRMQFALTNYSSMTKPASSLNYYIFA